MTAHRRRAAKLFAVLAIVFLAAGPGARGQTAPEHAPTANQPAPAANQPAPDPCRRTDFKVVLDVGHTVAVPGAMSARGVPEYTFNLQLAQDAKTALAAAGFDKTVLLITAKAPTLGLFERAYRANAMKADLFIAIHHDSVPDYLMQTWDYNGQPEGYNDDYPGYAIFISEDNAARTASFAFGKLLGAALQARGLAYTPHYTLPLMRNRRRELLDPGAGVYRYDQLIVLKETRMPAVLLEAGSIVNRQEELVLASPERRALESAAITSAVEEFCTARANMPRPQLVKRVAAPHAPPPTRGIYPVPSAH